ncbi:hypothetical protein THICB3110268 [Thiomonas sp. CB3]|nr:hypothetical protein THICB3110268 [Thiomonas sp. CB3]
MATRRSGVGRRCGRTGLPFFNLYPPKMLHLRVCFGVVSRLAEGQQGLLIRRSLVRAQVEEPQNTEKNQGLTAFAVRPFLFFKPKTGHVSA